MECRRWVRFGVTSAALFASVLSHSADVTAQDSKENPRDSVPVYTLEPITVQGRLDDLVGFAPTSSSGFVGLMDLRLRPIAREGELLEVVPGMALTQHSGSGKANQMFVRGFNLDHGTDFATSVEGMPVNLVTHAHGQGYTDLNFLVPELVESVEYSLGTYYADIGDFGSAGGSDFRLRRSLERPLFSLSAGHNGLRRMVGAGSTAAGRGGSFLVGGEARTYDGPWERPEDLRKLSGMARYAYEADGQTVSLLFLGYDSRWQASDQIPTRAVQQGLVGRFGQIDPTLGGTSSRYSLSAGWTRSASSGSQHVDLYAVRYALDLYSNFTYFLDDPARGDQIRQVDDGRWTVGANLGHLQPLEALGRPHELHAGVQLRGDMSDLTLGRTAERALFETVRFDTFRQWSSALYAELTTRWTSSLRSVIGLRGDAFFFDVASDRQENSGAEAAGLVSPKLSLAWMPGDSWEVYASAGLGFHSNDARGVLTSVDPVSDEPVDPVDPLASSLGAEIGARSAALSGRLVSTATLWAIHLDSELVYVGDAGRVEASDPSRRVGVTVSNTWRVSNTWSMDADVSFTRARFQSVEAGANRIPGAVENVVGAGVAREPVEDGAFGALRLRHLGAYPLIEDNSERARASSRLSLSLGYAVGGWRLSVTALNLLDETASDIQYFYASRLPGEPLEGAEDVHFHPAEPRQLRLTLSRGF